MLYGHFARNQGPRQYVRATRVRTWSGSTQRHMLGKIAGTRIFSLRPSPIIRINSAVGRLRMPIDQQFLN